MNFNEFSMYLFRRKRGGALNAGICMGTHSQPLLQYRLMDVYETCKGWSTHGPLQVLLFFSQIPPGADPGRGQKRSRGVPFFNKLFLQTGRLQQQTEFIAMIKKHVGCSIVTFESIPKSNFWPVFSSPEPKARVSYCHSAPSVVRHRRPSSSFRKLFTLSTSSPEPLDGFWWNLVGMKYSWSLTSIVVFQPDPPRGGSRAGPK